MVDVAFLGADSISWPREKFFCTVCSIKIRPLFKSKMPPIVLWQNYMMQQEEIVKIGVGGSFLEPDNGCHGNETAFEALNSKI